MKQPKTPKKTIYIQCSAKTHLSLDQFRMMPHHLKDRKRKQVEKLTKLIIDNGFMFPIFVWEHPQVAVTSEPVHYTIIDGHGRYNALRLLEKRGYTIPDIPVVLIQADNEQHAKKKLLEAGNLNGLFNFDEFTKYTKDLQLDLSDLFVPNISDSIVAAVQDMGFFLDVEVPGQCRCPKCGKMTPIKS